VIIEVVDVVGILALELEDDTPVATDVHCPVTFVSPFQWMEPKPWKIHVPHARRGVQSTENELQAFRMIGSNAGGAPFFEEATKPLVAPACNHDEV